MPGLRLKSTSGSIKPFGNIIVKALADLDGAFTVVEQVLEISNVFIVGFKAVIEFKNSLK